MKIAVFGAGYVGMSLAAVLCVQHEVSLIDIDPNKVQSINKGGYPVNNMEIHGYLDGKSCFIKATAEPSECKDSDYVLVATPTNFDPETKHFDTGSVESVLNTVHAYSPRSTVVIRSTVPIGFTEEKSKRFKDLNILFSPEFLREGNAIMDSLSPSRMIVGVPSIGDVDCARKFADLMRDAIKNKDCKVLITGSTEAESAKLFSNAYLAMRVAFFNELDSYAEMSGLDTKQIIEGVCMDPRIGDYYNNPSFGYGGYCLPKDTKQLLSDYGGTPNSLIRSVVSSNRVRKEFVAERIVSRLHGRKVVGIYRLVMKSGSDNFRESSILDVIEFLKKKDLEIILYEPLLKDPIRGVTLTNDIEEFFERSDLVVTNRWDDATKEHSDKVYCRDLFYRE